MKRLLLSAVAACALVGATPIAHADVTTPAYPEGSITVTVVDPALMPGESTQANVTGDPNVPFEAYINTSADPGTSAASVAERFVASGTFDGSGHAQFTVGFPGDTPYGTYTGRVVSTVSGQWRQVHYQIVVNSTGVMPPTGSDSLPLARLGLVAVAAGLLATVIGRRRAAVTV
jgi:hypothetical protein